MSLFRKSTNTRHIINQTSESLKVTIKSRRHIGAVLFTILWLLMWIYMLVAITTIWSISLLVITGNFDPNLQEAPLFVLLFCAVSVFLLAIIVMGIYGLSIFLREVAGKELITLNKDNLLIAYQLFGRKKEKDFPKEKAEKIITRNTKYHFFQSPRQKRFRFAFELNDGGKIHRFGYLVNEDEATEIISAIQSFNLQK